MDPEHKAAGPPVSCLMVHIRLKYLVQTNMEIKDLLFRIHGVLVCLFSLDLKFESVLGSSLRLTNFWTKGLRSKRRIILSVSFQVVKIPMCIIFMYIC